jgi:mevalonate kinase
MTAAAPLNASLPSTACGKVILLGEHAVVYGVPALCAALKQGAAVQGVPGDGRLRVPAWQVATATAGELLSESDARSGAAGESPPLHLAYRAILHSLSGVRALKVDSLPHDFVASFAIPTGAGLGSSAALAVALTRCIDTTLSLRLLPEHIAAAALAAEQVFHGRPSGLDHTIAQSGGFGLFQKERGLSPLVDLPTGASSLTLIIGHTGRARDTKGRVARVAELYRQDEKTTAARFVRIAELVAQAAAALKQGDLAALGAAMNSNQAELEGLEVSCPEIEEMCELARAAGAYGAKLTGGGGGGCVVALAPGKEALVTAAWQKAGYKSFVVKIGT